MEPRTEIQRGTLIWIALKTLNVSEPLHGYGIARRIEQISRNHLAWNQGAVYPLFPRLERRGAITSEWDPSENNRRRRFYRLRRAGRNQLQAALEGWEQTAEIVGRFLAINAETRSCS
jgi:PadR family transcriptional regulator, regulatory protein PadR